MYGLILERRLLKQALKRRRCVTAGDGVWVVRPRVKLGRGPVVAIEGQVFLGLS